MKTSEGNNGATMTITANDVKNLIKKKDDIEEQIKAYYDVLDDQGVGEEGSLVDAEGFPRSDVNLYQIRTARHNISFNVSGSDRTCTGSGRVGLDFLGPI
ncbi:unnamed protein product [Boreogadus saida]